MTGEETDSAQEEYEEAYYAQTESEFEPEDNEVSRNDESKDF